MRGQSIHTQTILRQSSVSSFSNSESDIYYSGLSGYVPQIPYSKYSILDSKAQN